MDMKSFNEQVIAEFRANEGKVAMFANHSMIILHSKGANSGNLVLVPLVLTEMESGERILFASFAGSRRNPASVYNLRANPEIKVELADGNFTARTVEYNEADAQQLIVRQAALSEQFADYVTKAAPRSIPVFRLEILK